MDIAKATKQSDIFDFLIDVVPGEVEKKEKNQKGGPGGGSVSSRSRKQSDGEEESEPKPAPPKCKKKAQKQIPPTKESLLKQNGTYTHQQESSLPNTSHTSQESAREEEEAVEAEEQAAINDHLLQFDEANDVTLPADFSEGIFGLNGWITPGS